MGREELLLIETGLVNTVANANNWAYVRVGDQYVRKQVRDLHEGDMVVIDNHSINKTLDDVIPTLEKSLRYRLARDELFERNSKGIWIPKLRTQLMRGLTSDLESTILLETGDFDLGDYDTFQERVMETGVGVQKKTVKSWLKGDRIAPRSWLDLRALSAINPIFEKYADSEGNDRGFHAAYQLYTGTHQVIMQYIARRTREDGTKRSETSKPGALGRYGPEIELVVDQFLREVDRNRSATAISRIKPLGALKKSRKRSVLTSLPKSMQGLRRALCTQEIPELDLIDLNRIRETHNILTNALYDFLNRYALRAWPTTGISTREEKTDSLLTSIFPMYAAIKLLQNADFERLGFETNLDGAVEASQLEGLETRDRSTMMQRINRMYDQFLEDVASGEADRRASFSPNTASRLVDLVNHHRSALPKRYFEMKRLQAQTEMYKGQRDRPGIGPKRKVVKDAERSLGKLVRSLRTMYGMGEEDSKKLFLPYRQERSIRMGLEFVSTTRDPAVLIMQKSVYEGQGINFFTKLEVQSVLTRLGISSVINIYEADEWI